MTACGAHAPCVICAGPIKRESGEREELWLSRKACSLPCRDQMRSRTQLARAATRLAQAVVAWTPGVSVTKLAQHHGIKGERLRDELVARGCDLTRARRGQPGRPPGSRTRHRKGGPPRDFLLEALLEAYGPRLVAADRKAG
jgi:hypothetical protein